ncbi:MAG TPA: DUF4097 family beta strand repeat-containing protein [Candidatus Limnocylindria bacterium]|nr:DUF4097 family beta strand repeat-containing protein [Candidatus Limnocylindria bacterium]
MTQTNEHVASIDHQIGPRGRFTLRQASGEVSIKGVEGNTVRVRSTDGDKALSEQFSIETGDGFVEMRQLERFGLGIRMFSGKDSPEIAVEVPHGATVSVETANADLEVSDLSGVKSFRTASGDVQLARLAGALDIETVSGDIELEGQAPMELAGRSISGDVRVRVPRLRRLELGTTSGDLWLDAELTGDGPFALRSISGDVTIVGRAGFRVEAETITGDLASDLPSKRESTLGRKVLIVGRPGPTLAFRSVSGDLHVVKPRDAAPPIAPGAELAPETPELPQAPTPPEPPGAPAAPAAPRTATAATESDTDNDSRLEILRTLERGEITVAEATQRLGELD